MIIYETEVFGPNFYVLFSKDGKNVEFIHLTKHKLCYSSILYLLSCCHFYSGFVYFGMSDSWDYRVLTIRDGDIVDDVSQHSSNLFLRLDIPKK